MACLIAWLAFGAPSGAAPPEGLRGASMNDVGNEMLDPPSRSEDSSSAAMQGILSVSPAPRAYTELVFAVRVVGVAEDAPVSVEVHYADAILTEPRLLTHDASWVYAASDRGLLSLTRRAAEDSLQQPVAGDVGGSGTLPMCEKPGETEPVARLALRVREPEDVSPEELALRLVLRTPDAFAARASACIASAALRSRGLVPLGE